MQSSASIGRPFSPTAAPVARPMRAAAVGLASSIAFVAAGLPLLRIVAGLHAPSDAQNAQIMLAPSLLAFGLSLLLAIGAALLERRIWPYLLLAVSAVMAVPVIFTAMEWMMPVIYLDGSID